jgi:hypothetical protein
MYLKVLLTIPLFLMFRESFSQRSMIDGTVIDSVSREPLAFVNITFDKSGKGTVSSIDGKFLLNVSDGAKELLFSYVGYNQKSIPLVPSGPAKNMIVELTPKAYDINEIYVYPGENPAHRIIDLASQNRIINNPERMGSFSYISYDKMIFTIDLDSLSEPVSSKKKRKEPQYISLFTEEDHSDTSMRKIIEKQHLVLMESISTREFIYPDKDKEKILASRVSGFEKPSFILMARQFQPFSFYGDFITISEKKYLNPLAPGSTGLYFFILEDTVFTERNDSVFIISFRPKNGKNFEGLKGLLYINSFKWAVQNVIAEASEQQFERISIKIQQKYDIINEHWFPVQLNTNLIFNNISAETNTKKMKVIGIGKSYLLNIRINPELNKKDFDNTYIEVSRNAHEMPEHFWERYRVDSLSEKDRKTYRVVDSIGRLKHFDRTFNDMETLMTGYLPGRYFNLDIRSVIDYNTYEGWRFGLGGITNRNLSALFDVGGHFAYGLKDKTWKYGISLNFNLDSRNNVYLKISYLDDLEEAGGLNFLEKKKLLSSESFRSYMVENMDIVQRKQAELGWKMFKYLSLNLFFRTSVNKPSNTYSYSITNENPRLLINQFDFTEAGIMTRFAYNEGFMMTPSGNKFSMGTKYPVLYLNITKGFVWLNGGFDFVRLETRLSKTFSTLRMGESRIQISGGLVRGKVPYSRLFAGNASYKSFGVESENSFATMRFNEFLSDRFVSFYFKQDFGSLITGGEKFRPAIAVVNNLGFGWLTNSEDHNNIEFRTAEKGYFECGILVNNLLNQKMFGYGLGLFYRYGPYSFSRIKNNFALKLTFALNL